MVIVISDGIMIFGLGNVEPFAGLAAMESKRLLFKYLDGTVYASIAVCKKDPRIWSWKTRARIVATGRSDFPNQINNGLRFPDSI